MQVTTRLSAPEAQPDQRHRARIMKPGRHFGMHVLVHDSADHRPTGCGSRTYSQENVIAELDEMWEVPPDRLRRRIGYGPGQRDNIVRPGEHVARYSLMGSAAPHSSCDGQELQAGDLVTIDSVRRAHVE